MNTPLVISPTREVPAEETRVHVDLGSMAGVIGRIKAPPSCFDETMKKEALTAEELTAFCFPLETPATKQPFCSDPEPHHEPSVVSSASSTASTVSSLSDWESANGRVLSTPLRFERRPSDKVNHHHINMKVTSQKTSRIGRQAQRYFTDPASQRVYRLVTGCVPVVEGGKILFVSSSRKPEWILPKGGWEKDEEMEESAIRECFEEAGVLGVLGPKLKEIDYETRKAKKRRLEFEELQKKGSQEKDVQAAPPVPETDETGGGCMDGIKFQPEPSPHPGNEQWNSIRGTSKQTDETSSTASDASQTHSHVRMVLFPLYVSEVKSTWPESGRLRKVVDIDEAIRICETRPELQAALKEVKEKNLYHLQTDALTATTLPTATATACTTTSTALDR